MFSVLNCPVFALFALYRVSFLVLARAAQALHDMRQRRLRAILPANLTSPDADVRACARRLLRAL